MNETTPIIDNQQDMENVLNERDNFLVENDRLPKQLTSNFKYKRRVSKFVTIVSSLTDELKISFIFLFYFSTFYIFSYKHCQQHCTYVASSHIY